MHNTLIIDNIDVQGSEETNLRTAWCPHHRVIFVNVNIRLFRSAILSYPSILSECEIDFVSNELPPKPIEIRQSSFVRYYSRLGTNNVANFPGVWEVAQTHPTGVCIVRGICDTPEQCSGLPPIRVFGIDFRTVRIWEIVWRHIDVVTCRSHFSAHCAGQYHQHTKSNGQPHLGRQTPMAHPFHVVVA